MKLGIMQPYFLPYIGYWQLIQAVDTFVLFDDVQYIRHGWVNRNRILKHGGGWQYIMIPLRKHPVNELIRNIQIHDASNWKLDILRQLEHYKYGRYCARHYQETIDFLHPLFEGIHSERLAPINTTIIREICRYLEIKTEIIVSSEKGFNYEDVQDAGEWALRISEQMGASEYVNPIGGRELFDRQKFESSHIKLSFLKSADIQYVNGPVFEPWLSIVDVLMFNGRAGTQALINQYAIQMA